MASRSDSAPTPSVAAPGRSNRLLRSAGTSGSTAAASSNVASVSGTWATKIQRQPKACTTGPPATTPITGAPAPTIDHQPIACARWFDENVRLMIASDAGPSAAPMAAPIDRHAIKTAAFGANAVRPANTHTPVRL